MEIFAKKSTKTLEIFLKMLYNRLDFLTWRFTFCRKKEGIRR